MKTLAQLRSETLVRIGDVPQAIWTADEVDGYLQNGYQTVGDSLRTFWDIVYFENLPAGFSMNYAWERHFLSAETAPFDYGVANLNMEDERLASHDERHAVGPADHTSPFEVLEGHYDAAGCDPAMPAVGQLYDLLTQLDRLTYDRRGIDAMEARRMSKVDARYEITQGEVYGYIWQKDGVRALRKIRVPAQRSDTIVFRGDFGTLRDIADLWPLDDLTGWEDPAFDPGGFDNDGFFTLAADAALWGVPRRIPGHHPMGFQAPGIPRRFFLEGMNVRIEHFRHGAPMIEGADPCELPDLYAGYLRDYAMHKCYERRGPGQDLKLSDHFKTRWARGLARIARRVELTDTEHVMVMGGDGRPSVQRPPKPKLPWNYGSTVRW